MEQHPIKKTVQEGYSKIAKFGSCCCSNPSSQIGCSGMGSNVEISKSIGYSDEELSHVPDANLGLGCGNPTALAEIKPGDTVLDLGSGAGMDAFLASKKVGVKGKVIGVDMTPEMIARAKANAKKHNITNTEFILGDIEDLPLKGGSIDVVISNCVINLAPDKDKVFNEAYRVLKKGGKLVASDIVLLKELSAAQRKDKGLICGCVGGAILRDAYLSKLKNAGFMVDIAQEDKDISKRQYAGIALESLKFVAHKK